MKNVVIDHIPKKITGMEFSALTPTEIIQQSEVEVITRDLYDIEKPGRQAKNKLVPLIPKWVFHLQSQEQPDVVLVKGT